MRDSLSQVRLIPQASMRQQLSRQVRDLIVSGSFSEGDRLPSNQELAARWQVATSSVQAAMATLVKEGLLHRARKRGTFVAKRPGKLTHAAIYVGDDIWRMRTAAFARSVVNALSVQLRKRKIQPVFWPDCRVQSDRGEPWPELMRAAEQRQVQAVLVVGSSTSNFSWLSRLSVPTATLASRFERHCIGVDNSYGERLAVEELARKGCRSVGILTPVTPAAQSMLSPSQRSTSMFKATAERLGLEVRKEWVRVPGCTTIQEPEAESFGYEQMKHLLTLRNRPDGMFITYDWAARGALMATLQSQVKVPEQMKLVLHRNVQIGLLCPLKVSFLDVDVDDIAKKLLQSIDAQIAGEEADDEWVRPRISNVR